MARSIHEIVLAAGGPGLICRNIGEKPDGQPALTESAVQKWRYFGIPEKHWALVIDMAKSNPDELFQANQARRLSEAMANSPPPEPEGEAA